MEIIKDDEMLRLEQELKVLLGISDDEIPDALVLEDEESPDFVEELKTCAFNIVRENPGIERSEWIDKLIRHYPSEVVDAYGNDPYEVYPLLEDMWDCNDYEDPETHDCMSFADWSEYFAFDPDALRDQLDRANERIRELENEVTLLREANKRLSGPPNPPRDTNPRQTSQNAADKAIETTEGDISNKLKT